MCKMTLNNGAKDVGTAVWTGAGWIVHVEGKAYLVRHFDDLSPVLKAGQLLQSAEAEEALEEFDNRRKRQEAVVDAIEKLQQGLQAMTVAKTQPFSMAALQAGATGNVDVFLFGALLMCAAGDRLTRVVRNLF